MLLFWKKGEKWRGANRGVSMGSVEVEVTDGSVEMEHDWLKS